VNHAWRIGCTVRTHALETFGSMMCTHEDTTCMYILELTTWLVSQCMTFGSHETAITTSLCIQRLQRMAHFVFKIHKGHTYAASMMKGALPVLGFLERFLARGVETCQGQQHIQNDSFFCGTPVVLYMQV
jgi:hypothetical protein